MKRSAALTDAVPPKIVIGLLGGLVATLIWVAPRSWATPTHRGLTACPSL
jgi:hypothetical protein